MRQAAVRERTGSVEARNQVCGELTNELRSKLARRYGGDSTLPGCGFVTRVPGLNGRTTLGDLTDLKEVAGHTVRARYRLGTGATARQELIEFTEVNPGHWQITALLGLRGTHG